MLVKHIFSKICRHVQYIKRQYMVCVSACVCVCVSRSVGSFSKQWSLSVDDELEGRGLLAEAFPLSLSSQSEDNQLTL